MFRVASDFLTKKPPTKNRQPRQPKNHHFFDRHGTVLPMKKITSKIFKRSSDREQKT